MHPALSVIFFTTLSGAGYGLLTWLGVSLALLHLRGHGSPELQRLHLAVLAVGFVLSTIGLLCSLGHLGQPQRAWRALSQWRTSWLSREGVASLVTAAIALVLGVLLYRPFAPTSAPLLGALGIVLAASALLTVVCTAMIYASLKPIPAWRHPLVVPVYLVFALATGLALQFLLMTWIQHGGNAFPMVLTLLAMGVALAAMKWLYWYETDRRGLPAARGDAIGLPERTATVFERPHTEASYVTGEMAFALARRHGDRLRWAATALLVAVPLLALVLGAAAPTASLLLALAGLLGGAFLERWLFFAQARHLVTLYY